MILYIFTHNKLKCNKVIRRLLDSLPLVVSKLHCSAVGWLY